MQSCDVLRRAADEECACNHIIDLPFLIPQGAVQRQAQQLALIVTDQGCVSSSWLVYNFNSTTNTALHSFKIALQFGFIRFPPLFNNYDSHRQTSPQHMISSISSGYIP